jgi:hypothetical protein
MSKIITDSDINIMNTTLNQVGALIIAVHTS